MTPGDRKKADIQLVTALAAGATVEAAAKVAGVSEPTVYRRLREPAFRQRVAELRDEMVARAVARLSATSTLAADTLRELLGARAETVRLGAARAILELGTKLRETEDLAARVAALEAQLAADQQREDRWRRTAG
jgi:hypothetical protein